MSGTLPQIEPEPKLTIILVGKTGGGRTSVMNTLLGRKDQNSEASPCSQTTDCKRETVQHGDQELVIIDTPGVLHTSKEDEVKKDIAGSLAHAAHDGGPHVFLLVMHPERDSEEDIAAVEIIQEIFGVESKHYTLVLFTRRDKYEPKLSVVKEMKSLKKVFDTDDLCDDYFHSFENIGCENVMGDKEEKKKEKRQVSGLLTKINIMVEKNKKLNRPRYSSEMLTKAQDILQQKQQDMSEPDCKETIKALLTDPWGELVKLFDSVTKKLAKCLEKSGGFQRI